MSAPIFTDIDPDVTLERIEKPPVVRTLKDPPEIWELVNPVEVKQFNLLQTLRTSATSLILLGMFLGMVIGVCLAVYLFLGAQEMIAVETGQPFLGGSTSNSLARSAAAIDGSVTQPIDESGRESSTIASSPSVRRKVGRAVQLQERKRRPDIQTKTTPDAGPRYVRSQPPKTNQRPIRVTSSDKKIASDSALTKPKSTTRLGPQVIAPLESEATSKAKVIPWP